MSGRAKRLHLLAGIAELRAARAKSDLADARAEAGRLQAQITALREARREMARQMPDPGLARARAAWLAQTDRELRALSAELARARALSDERMDRARWEEGRRQALAKLGDQAS